MRDNEKILLEDLYKFQKWDNELMNEVNHKIEIAETENVKVLYLDLSKQESGYSWQTTETPVKLPCRRVNVRSSKFSFVLNTNGVQKTCPQTSHVSGILG